MRALMVGGRQGRGDPMPQAAVFDPIAAHVIATTFDAALTERLTRRAMATLRVVHDVQWARQHAWNLARFGALEARLRHG